jgi:hypothetical protein
MFRDLNETIEKVAKAGGEGAILFMCECGDDFCAEDVELNAEQYESVRAVPTRFVVRPGHDAPDVETVVEQNPGYWVVEKTGSAADIARETDPRT